MIAAEKGYLPVVQALLTHKKTAQVQLTATNNPGQTALALAEASGQSDVVTVLRHTMTSTADATDSGDKVLTIENGSCSLTAVVCSAVF
jgi:hypothetical protein